MHSLDSVETIFCLAVHCKDLPVSNLRFYLDLTNRDHFGPLKKYRDFKGIKKTDVNFKSGKIG